MKLLIRCTGLLLIQGSFLLAENNQPQKSFYSVSAEIAQFLSTNEYAVTDSLTLLLENKALFINTVEFYAEFKNTLHAIVNHRDITETIPEKKETKIVKGFTDMISFYIANKNVIHRAGNYFASNQEKIKASLTFFSQYGETLVPFVLQRNAPVTKNSTPVKAVNLTTAQNHIRGISEMTDFFTKNQADIKAMLEYFEEREWEIMTAMEFFSKNANILKQKIGC